MAGQNGRQRAYTELPYVTVGTARLPNAFSEEQSRMLAIELTVSLPGARIVDVASSIPLPGYTALLRGLLNGLQLDQVEEAAQGLEGHLCGPLLRPTIAALQKAVAASTHGTGTASANGAAALRETVPTPTSPRSGR